jgi:D-lactate dehydrogenase (cytochrome)
MRRQVLGLTVVLADGRVIRTGGRTAKSSAGYDLTQLFVGSEGTLGAIVELTLRLHAIPDHVVAARATFAELDAACGAARALVATGASVSRLELLDAGTVRAINAFKDTAFTEAPSLFLEFSGSSAAVEEDAAFARAVMQEHGCLEVQFEADHTTRVRLWQARHDAAFAIAATRAGGRILSTDVCVPLSELPGAVGAARATADRLGLDVAIVGHAGDGNYHVVLIFDPDDPQEVSRADALKAAISADALARGGTCSGEHGIGLGKLGELEAQHGDLLPLMRGIKRVLDPHGIMNPGKVFRS